MTSTIHEHGGVIEKYMGDAITALWGVDGNKNHAQNACESALICLRRVHALSSNWSKSIPKVEVNVRIGINTGHVAIGNFGSEERLGYMVIGDHVNLASRLQGANKHFGTHILISQMTQELLDDSFLTREVDTVMIKGKIESIKLYTLESIKIR